MCNVIIEMIVKKSYNLLFFIFLFKLQNLNRKLVFVIVLIETLWLTLEWYCALQVIFTSFVIVYYVISSNVILEIIKL